MVENTRIWKWMVGLLAILNIVLLVTIWYKPAHHDPPPMREGGPAQRIIHELNLNDAQIRAFEKLKDDHHSSMIELQEKSKELRDDFFELLKQENPDQKLVTEKSQAIAKNQEEIEQVTFSHFEQVRKLCNPDQKKKFDEMIKDILHTMAGSHGPRGEHP